VASFGGYDMLNRRSRYLSQLARRLRSGVPRDEAQTRALEDATPVGRRIITDRYDPLNEAWYRMAVLRQMAEAA
jgi:hypothetical protein